MERSLCKYERGGVEFGLALAGTRRALAVSRGNRKPESEGYVRLNYVTRVYDPLAAWFELN